MKKPELLPPLDLGPNADPFWSTMTASILAIPEEGREAFICETTNHAGTRQMMRDLVRVELWKREVLSEGK